MKGYWSRITRLSQGTRFAVSLLALAACGTGQFSEDFSTEIQRDCIETVGCFQMGQVESCIASVGQTLDGASTSKQQWFVDAVYRCQGQAVCDWVNCVQSTNMGGFAAMRLNEITFDCQQRAICQGAQNSSEDKVRECVQQTGNRLNADAVSQAEFDGRFVRCGQQQGCNYSSCQ
jgi:hypothetical protein